MTKHIVIGLGEVGMALAKVFKCDGEDKHKGIEAPREGYKYLHIAFPYKDESFIDEVKAYQEKHDPKYTIIHSTVPIGTSDKCNALFSPIRGIHPHLVDSIKTFKKFIGGDACFEVAVEFKKFRVSCVCTRDTRNIEALKMWSTTQYGAFLMLNKEIYKYCEDNNLDFNIVYTIANETYNDGYTKMLMPNVVRPILEYRDEPIGGHCVIPNCKILESETAKEILEKNGRL